MRPFGLYMNGDTVISGSNEDELGVLRVKRHRLVLPGEDTE